VLSKVDNFATFKKVEVHAQKVESSSTVNIIAQQQHLKTFMFASY